MLIFCDSSDQLDTFFEERLCSILQGPVRILHCTLIFPPHLTCTKKVFEGSDSSISILSNKFWNFSLRANGADGAALDALVRKMSLFNDIINLKSVLRCKSFLVIYRPTAFAR